jgi:hypothetical protein
MKDATFARERSILFKPTQKTLVVHYTTKPESFADTFVVRANDFGGLCVYLLDDVPRAGMRAFADANWPGRTMLIIEVASDDVLLLQYAPIEGALDEYFVRCGAEARVLTEE